MKHWATLSTMKLAISAVTFYLVFFSDVSV